MKKEKKILISTGGTGGHAGAGVRHRMEGRRCGHVPVVHGTCHCQCQHHTREAHAVHRGHPQDPLTAVISIGGDPGAVCSSGLLPDVDCTAESGVGTVHAVHLVPAIELHYTCTGTT